MVKLFLIGVFVGLAIGVGLTVFYFSLAKFFELNAKALEQEALNPSLKESRTANEEAQNALVEDETEEERKVAS